MQTYYYCQVGFSPCASVFFLYFSLFFMCFMCVCILYIFFVYIFCMYLCVFVYICVYIFVYILFFPNVRKICSLSSEQSIRYPCSVQYICISPVLFCPVFALSMYICMLCVFVCIFVCLCVCLCVFPLEWNILCCIYAIYCTFYRTYVLVLQYLALYGIICLQLNSGYVKTALICPHNPILVFLAFLAFQSSRAL